MIITFGSIGLDIVQSVRDLPRPGETVLTGDYAMLPGGKGANQALAAARAGGDVSFVASIGDDDFGQRALGNLVSAGIDVSGVARAGRPTACATISVDSAGENQIVVSSGANLETTAAQLHPQAGDLVLQQMEIRPGEIWAGIDGATEAGARTILNAAPFQSIPPASLAKLDVLIVNEVEAAMLAEDLALDGTNLRQTCALVQRRFDLTVVLTLGGDGALALDELGTWQAGALAIQAIDTVGAGDAFVGAFVAAMAEGKALAECLRWGSVAGGLACLYPGAQDGVPKRPVIESRLNEIQINPVDPSMG
ncbi:MAG: ribokinase [Rhodospirillaceae bacterium]|nr:ribokinase [Rhodospirillaceae bacterium]